MELIRPDAGSLAAAAAEWVASTLDALPGRLAVSLSGGSTPKRLYEELARPPLLDRMPWDRIHWFWGDERFVPPDDARSNTAMVRAAMLDRAPVPPGHVHPVPTVGISPQDAARSYDAFLRTFKAEQPGRPLFDLVLLGLGTNGHTASLFPGEAVLQERTAWAAPVTPPGEPTRITLTWPPLEDTRHAVFLVAGAEKREMIARTRARDLDVVAAHYATAGQLHWFMDLAAAG
jgi:6-phosphogluconolactonase